MVKPILQPTVYAQRLGESADESRLATMETPLSMGLGDDSG